MHAFKRFFLSFIIGVSIFSFLAIAPLEYSVLASDVVDQENPSSNCIDDTYIHYSSSLADELGQGFTPSTSGAIPFIDLYVKKIGSPSGNISIQLRSDSSGVPSGTTLATSDVIDASTISTSYSYVRFYFSSPYTVSASTVYHIATVVTYSFSTGSNNISWCSDPSPVYAFGVSSFLNSGSWSAQSTDMIFQQYVSVTPSPTPTASPTPPPLGEGTSVVRFDDETNQAIGDTVKLFFVVGGLVLFYIGFRVGLSLYKR